MAPVGPWCQPKAGLHSSLLNSSKAHGPRGLDYIKVTVGQVDLGCQTVFCDLLHYMFALYVLATSSAQMDGCVGLVMLHMGERLRLRESQPL